MGKRGNYNGVAYGIACPFCGGTYGVTNFSGRPAPDGSEDVDPGAGSWNAHTVACWAANRADKEADA